MKKSEFMELNVLVLEENGDNVNLVKSILYYVGIKQIVAVTSGEGAFKKLGGFYPDLVLCNPNLEGENGDGSGLEFVRRLRSKEGGPNKTVPVIMMSEYTAAKNIIDANKAGANSFLAKPLSGNSLMSGIISVLKKANMPGVGSLSAASP